MFKAFFIPPLCSLSCLVAVTCGCARREPEVEIDQEQAIKAIRMAILAEPVLFERTEYNPLPESVVEKWIDPAIQTGIEKRNFGRWPRTHDEAMRIANLLKPNAWRSVLDAPEGRALVEQRMQAYWEEPKISVTSQAESVECDLGVTPGPIVLTSRGYYSIESSSFEQDAGLIPSELVRRLTSLRDNYPAANRWRVKVIVRPYIERQSPIIYEYSRTDDRLFVYSHKEVYYSPVVLDGKLDRLLTGESPIQPRDMKILPKNLTGKPFAL